MNIIIDARCIFDSGIGVYIREVLSRLSLMPFFRVEVIVMACHVDRFQLLDIKVEKIHKVDFSRYSIKNIYALNSILSRAELYIMPALSLPPFSKTRKITIVHDLCPIALRSLFGYFTAVVYWILLGWQILLSKRIVCISKFTRNEMHKYFPFFSGVNFSVVHNGLSTRLAKGLFKDNVQGFNLSTPYILCVGNIKPHKNIVNMVRHFSRKSIHSCSYKLVVVGNADGFRTGADISNELDECVFFTGFINDQDLASLYNNAKAFIFPSYYEGFGLPILEAMSFELPILASDIPVFREVAGEYIVYFDHMNFNDFDIKLAEVLGRGPADYSDILEKYTWEKSVSKIVGIIKNEDSTNQ